MNNRLQKDLPGNYPDTPISATEHPAEEILIGYSLDHENKQVEEHLKTCAHCCQLVEEIRFIKESMILTGNQEPPEEIRKRVNGEIRRPHSLGLLKSILEHLPNQVFIVALTLVSYVIFMFVMIALLD